MGIIPKGEHVYVTKVKMLRGLSDQSLRFRAKVNVMFYNYKREECLIEDYFITLCVHSSSKQRSKWVRLKDVVKPLSRSKFLKKKTGAKYRFNWVDYTNDTTAKC